MGLLGSLYSGVSGLTANGDAISVIGNNVANANTVGFKASRIEFKDVISSQGAGDRIQIGRGVSVKTAPVIFSQGGLQGTSSALDLAIQGNGMFAVRSQLGLGFTRAGAFFLDKDGFVVNSSGAVLQGYQLDASGQPSSSLQDLSFSTASAPPQATGSNGAAGEGVRIAANLDARSTVKAAFDINDPDTTTNFRTTVKVFDSLGASHDVTVYFRKASDNNWEWYSVTDGSNIEGGTEGTPVLGDQGTLTFNPDGSFASSTVTTRPWDFAGGPAQDQTIAWTFGDATDPLAGTTQFSNQSLVQFAGQDGRAAGDLVGLRVDPDGRVTGTFTNGAGIALAQIALADFPSFDGLRRIDGGTFAATLQSGEPIFGQPQFGQFGSLVSNALELSNVDIAEQFVQLIQHQRGFQAASRIITTTDQLMAETVQLTR